jgi:hypothetical protein
MPELGLEEMSNISERLGKIPHGRTGLSEKGLTYWGQRGQFRVSGHCSRVVHLVFIKAQFPNVSAEMGVMNQGCHTHPKESK